MIKRLFAQVVETISLTETVTADDREAALRLATAILMVDVARADYVVIKGKKETKDTMSLCLLLLFSVSCLLSL